jgi:hypothetical protein
MELRDKIKNLLRKNYGEFNTLLENQYEETITENLISENKINREAWATYNQVILELKHTLKDINKVKELQYKLTDGDTSKTVVIEVIKDVKEYSPELNRLYHKIKNFKE